MTSFMFAGPAGAGAMVAGKIFAKFCQKLGFSVFANVDYPSLIRGGVNTYEVNFRKDSALCLDDFIDILVVLNQDCFNFCKSRLKENSFTIFDNNIFKLENKNSFGIPLTEIAEKFNNVKNVVALGACLALFGFDLNDFNTVLENVFKHKSKEIIDNNKNAAKAGFDFFTEHYKEKTDKISLENLNKLRKKLKTNSELKTDLPKNSEKKLLITGNEALSLGAINAGMKFYCAYPMTPASSILHYLAAKEKDAGIVVRQVEDEIAVLNMALGASFTGVKSMVASSGGGFSLMIEALGLSAMAEIPIVIVEVMRQGPSTGVPTQTSQGDLASVLFCSQGEFPRVVLLPGDVEECFYQTINAFNLAYKFQIPALILSDKFIAESFQTVKTFNTKADNIQPFIASAEENFKRYKFTENGISPMSKPGIKNGEFVASSYEHDEFGHSVEDSESIKKMVDKRFNKLEFIKKEIPKPILHGEKNADITLVSWGSTKGTILESIKILKKQNINVNFLQIISAQPFCAEEVKDVLSNSKNIILVENSKTGFMADLVEMHTGIEIKNKILKYDGLPFFPADIVNDVLRLAKNV